MAAPPPLWQLGAGAEVVVQGRARLIGEAADLSLLQVFFR